MTHAEPASLPPPIAEVRGRRALVTGAASGIGAGLVERFAAEGATVVATDVDDDDGRGLAEAAGAAYHHLDVADPTAWDRLAAAVGPIDVACLNAGVVAGATDLGALDLDVLERTVRVNVDGVLVGLRALLVHQMLRVPAVVLVTSSLGGLTAMPSDPVYAATKHAAVGLVRSAAPQLAGRGIRLQALCPGIVDTPMVTAAFRAELDAAGYPLISVDAAVDGAIAALRSRGTGEAWVVQAGRAPEPYRFRGVPGTRVPGAEGRIPPGVPGG